MRASEITNTFEGITESPQMVGDTNFNLDDDAANAKLAKSLLKKIQEIIIDDSEYQLIRTGTDTNGNIALITKDQLPKINYLVRYETKNYSSIGSTVTQVLLWRRLSGAGVIGITAKVFFDYLLKKWPAIMSDGQQTARGKEFWITRMQDATNRGFKVGLANLNLKDIIWYNPKESLEDWLKANNGWGSNQSDIARRYLISN
jgi:hypothetical protein